MLNEDLKCNRFFPIKNNNKLNRVLILPFQIKKNSGISLFIKKKKKLMTMLKNYVKNML